MEWQANDNSEEVLRFSEEELNNNITSKSDLVLPIKITESELSVTNQDCESSDTLVINQTDFIIEPEVFADGVQIPGGSSCPYCGTVFETSDRIVLCANDKTPHHLDCWNENCGCTTFGCNSNNYVTGQEEQQHSGGRRRPAGQMPVPQSLPTYSTSTETGLTGSEIVSTLLKAMLQSAAFVLPAWIYGINLLLAQTPAGASRKAQIQEGIIFLVAPFVLAGIIVVIVLMLTSF